MKIMHFVAAVACLFLAADAVHLSASCQSPAPPLCESAARADLVFFGEVLEQIAYTEQTERGPIPQGIQAVRFNVIRAFKGVDPGESSRLFYFGVDQAPFSQGARYLVFAHRRATGAFVHGCTPTREIATRDEAAWLRTEGLQLAACFKVQR
jgi:hypothetical protein